MRMCVSICIRTSLLFYIPTHLSPCSYVCMFRLFCNDPLYPMYSNCYTSLCTCSERLGPMLTQLWLHVQGSVFQYSSISMLPINTHIPCSDQKCSILWTPTPHQDPFLFKNRLLGLAHFLAGKMISFFQILIFSYPPFRLVYKPKNRGNSTGAGLTPFRRKTFLQTNPRFGSICGGGKQFSNLLDGLAGAENLRFQGPRQIQIAENFRRSGVPRELHNKPLLVQKVCWIQFTAAWYKPRVSSKTNRWDLLKSDNQFFEKKIFLLNYREYLLIWHDVTLGLVVEKTIQELGVRRSKHGGILEKLTWTRVDFSQLWIF